MKILVTVGTSAFNSLIKAVDEQLKPKDYQVICQIADGSYKPQKHNYLSFSNNFDDLIDFVDIVITHGGAGTIFNLLERGKKLLVVPNLERIDKHQMDLCNFIDINDYGVICPDLKKLLSQLKYSLKHKPKKYQKEEFFMANDIVKYLS
jgi:UDP-N-acetylglucosamine transferase subunit ALG13